LVSRHESRPIRVGIIGTGGMGPRHAKGVQAVGADIQLAAACDLDPARLAKFGQDFGVLRLSREWRELTAAPDLDAVIVLLPHNLHEAVCVDAARRGKHILVEKPIARTLGEADRMIDAARRAGVVLMAAHNQRFYPVNQKIHQLLDEDVLGELFSARIDHHQNFAPAKDRAWWRSAEAAGGGCVIGSGIHRLDLLRWYLGEAREVFAFQAGDPARLEAEVVSVAVIRFAGGAVAEFYCNWGAPHPPATVHEGLSLFGRSGCLYYDGAIRVCSPHLEGAAKSLVVVEPEAKTQSMWEHFAKCIRAGAAPLTSGDDARRSLELVLAIYRSAETGQSVRLPLA